MPDETPAPFSFPDLPIISVDPPKPKTETEKYGSFFYFGVIGLVVVVGLVGWFGWSVWSLRAIWTNVYVLHDETRSNDVRIQAAYALSRDPRVNAQQRWDIALRKPLPAMARYLIAESWTPDAVRADPPLFARVVGLSEGWPAWLRLLGVRVMAIAAAAGIEFSVESLDTLAQRPEPGFRTFVDYIRAVSGDRAAVGRLQQAPAEDSLAQILGGAIEVDSFERTKRLEDATRLLRTVDPESVKVWEGWTERANELVRIK